MVLDKIDFKKSFKAFYSPSAKAPELVRLPRLQFLAVDGEGAPESAAFQKAVEAMYGIAYTVKFARKKAGASPDYSIGPLEGLWGMQEGRDFDLRDRDHWRWTLLLWQPDFIGESDLRAAVDQLRQKKENPALSEIRLKTIEEGRAAQIMHVGPFSEEPATIERLHAFIAANGLRFRGMHHEVYLSDPRRGDPAKMKTILRQPVE